MLENGDVVFGEMQSDEGKIRRILQRIDVKRRSNKEVEKFVK